MGSAEATKGIAETLDETRKQIASKHATEMEKIRASIAKETRATAIAIMTCAIVVLVGALLPLSIWLWRWALS